ncbi:MAG TPA: hypothetical protein PLI95_25375, partial [Polyangiaceae bacterium]|nr:hypothetical protein [Polyangiaceae bacterium]
MTESGAEPDRTFRGPIVSPVACPGCGRLVDPLRAGHVAIFHDRFQYFCDWSCRQDYLTHDPEGHAPPKSMEPLRKPSARPAARGDAPKSSDGEERETILAKGRMEAQPEREDVEEAAEWATQGEPGASRSDLGTLLLLSATVSGVLSLALALVGTSATVLTVRVVVGVVGVALLTARAVLTRRDPADPHPAVVLVPTAV